MPPFDGLACGLDTLHRLSRARSRSISAENFTGEKGKGGMAVEGTGAAAAAHLGRGWKVSPYVRIEPGSTFTLGDIPGPGAIQTIWCTGDVHPRFTILRIYWDDQAAPSVECPVGDFFCNGWGQYTQLSSLAVCLNPGRGAMNCYWPMPFRRRARVTLTNMHNKPAACYYQINYALNEVAEDAAYFHAQFRRTNPLPYKEVYTILDGVRGQGHYAGTYLAWGVNNNGWWGEGEVKFYLDGDGEFPTICGTGTEDYFTGCYNFDAKGKGYTEFTTPYAGLHQVLKPDGLYQSQMRFGMYRWHIPDPVRFERDLRVTIQALGWRGDGQYQPLRDDIASVAYWYQTLPTAPFPTLPDKEVLEVV